MKKVKILFKIRGMCWLLTSALSCFCKLNVALDFTTLAFAFEHHPRKVFQQNLADTHTFIVTSDAGYVAHTAVAIQSPNEINLYADTPTFVVASDENHVVHPAVTIQPQSDTNPYLKRVIILSVGITMEDRENLKK